MYINTSSENLTKSTNIATFWRGQTQLPVAKNRFMNNRFMRLLIFFDLPMETSKDRREYSCFHKFLIKSGFIMMQKSVYSKLVINNVTSDAVKKKVAENLPPVGVVELLEVTENQFSRINYLVGEKQTLVEESTERLIEV